MSETKDKIDQNTEEEKNHEVAEEQSSASYEGVEREELIRQLEELKEQNGTFQEQLSEAKDAHLRKAAEFENFRKRVQRERAQIYESAKANALEDFLSISDDLSRTLEASNELEVNPTFLEGVTLVANKFNEVLEKHGVLRIDQEGVPFDVDLHDALMRRKPKNESIESDRVLKVIENGYKIGDRTIRHAKVIVSE